MISRHWHGIVKSDQADAYVIYLLSETFPGLETIQGFLGAEVLKREVAEGIEFLVVTRWASIDAVRAFAGQDAGTAVVSPKAQAMMVDYDRVVQHYHVVSRL
ncbi:MAG: antibiotic biosynthesis monooxygenase [Cytophagaceae bacterium]|nr:antibiotic biosynthesis monooxygenase [Gemmatimonadaceae bacterium]